MKIKIVLSLACYLVYSIALAKAQVQNCTNTPLNVPISEEVNCEDGMVEVLDEGNSDTHVKTCCIPDTEGERITRRRALGCQTSQCGPPTFQPCSEGIRWRRYNGELLIYEEISFDTCASSQGQRSVEVQALCCRRNSTEGLLATTYGAEYNEFPFMALLDTGGQCAETGEVRQSDGTWNVKVGRNVVDISMPQNDYGVELAIAHPEYRERVQNDIALLRLDRDIQFGPRVQALQIPPRGLDEIRYSDNAVIIGWGRTDTLELSDNLQKTNVMLRTDQRCFVNSSNAVAPWSQYFNITEVFLCMGGILKGKFSASAAPGDSGGPAVCRGEDGFGVLCGISSFGTDYVNCTTNINEQTCGPSVFTEVDFFRDWIEMNAGIQEASTLHRLPLYGEEIPNDRYEHQVHITSAEGKPCGGTLISLDYVVTAAQCIAPGDGSSKTFTNIMVTTRGQGSNPIGITNISILAGFRRVGEPVNITAQGFRVVRTDNIYRNDLAILRLTERVSINPSNLARLPRNEDFQGRSAIELSFPRESGRGTELRQRQFNILSKTDCQRRIDRLVNVGIMTQVARNIFCGVETYSGGSTCDRELGGGLICRGGDGRDVLCGIQVYRLCEWSVPNGFIDVAQYASWIDANTN